MRCPKCHAENRDDSKFCGNCAAPLGAGAGPDAASLTKTLETPVRALKPGTLVAGKYRAGCQDLKPKEAGYLDFFLAVSALLLRLMSAAWARL